MDFKVEPLQNQPTIDSQIQIQTEPKWSIFDLIKDKIKTKYIAVGLGLIMLVAVIFFLMGNESFSESGVELKIEGPTEISSGDLVEYKVIYKNDNKIALDEAKLVFFYPPDSIVVKNGAPAASTNEVFELGKIDGGGSGEKFLPAYVIGDKGNIKNARAILTYQPESVSSVLEKTANLNTTITNLAVPVTLVVPPTAVNGQAVGYLVDYRNQSDQNLVDLRFRVSYPDGFKVSRYSPQPSSRDGGQDIWDVKLLKQGEGSRITIEGQLSGRERESKTVMVTLQKKVMTETGDFYVDFQKSEASSVIATPLLSADVSVNGTRDYVAHLGDTLRYRINFFNNTNFDINNLTLSAKLDGTMFDMASIRTTGFFDGRLNTVFWNGSAIPELNNLRPNQSGFAEFEVKLKPNFSGVPGARESFVKISVRLETPNVPPDLALDKLTADDDLVTRISSAPTFSQSIRISDAEWGTSGPYPPKADQKTIFTINWKLVNPANDISPAKITAILAPGVSWENRTRVNGNQPQPSYNSQTKTVTWDLGNLPAGVGVNFPAYEAFFQVSVVPSINQVGNLVDLLRTVRFEGTDIFTKEKIIRTAPDINTSNVVDSNQGGTVRP